MEKKENIQTVATFSQTGLMLDEIIWRGTKHYPIERLLHVCTYIDGGKQVLRHTVLIGGKQRYLYQDRDQWYVRVSNTHKGEIR